MEVDYRKFESALQKLGQGVEDNYAQNDRPVEKERVSVEDLIAIHDKAVELYGGEYGPAHPKGGMGAGIASEASLKRKRATRDVSAIDFTYSPVEFYLHFVYSANQFFSFRSCFSMRHHL